MKRFVDQVCSAEIFERIFINLRVNSWPAAVLSIRFHKPDALSARDEICITEDVYGAPAVAEIVTPYPVARSEAELKGVSRAMSVYRLGPMAS